MYDLYTSDKGKQADSNGSPGKAAFKVHKLAMWIMCSFRVSSVFRVVEFFVACTEVTFETG
jgi:hypothetical protein